MFDPNQVFLLLGIVVALLLTFIFPLLFQNRKARLLRFFRRDESIRFPLVLQTSKNHAGFPDDISPAEMVAILMLIVVSGTVSGSFAVAERFSSMGWASKFNDVFFDRLNVIARRLSARQWNRDSADLFRLGQMIAQAHNFPFWEREFTESISRLKYQRVQSGLPTRQK